ncbi:hypothetical protein NBZ79_02475 [Sneathiella marina]|uniref:Bacterial Pleckstrin homology domain-containing protein n=1 Tax=Sneathiella marina TaxID=2950108 RepID=A0ABY4W6S7_9PROT|nr:hypothetical protein [Sneathiella marina]USG61838.1 hypothetical protein NBZ79_02475 [Sneathiella marina]
MNYQLIGRFIKDRLKDPSLYWLALIVGTAINCYGHLLVPWMRSGKNPFLLLLHELEIRPFLTISTILITFCFPFGVALYSSVGTRYKNRRLESIADFPDRNPSPVFRATRDGKFVEVGAVTSRFFSSYNIETAYDLIGRENWQKIANKGQNADRFEIDFKPEGARYLVAHAHTNADQINVYLTRISR